MFQFPTSPSITLCIHVNVLGYSPQVGFPIRTSTTRRLFASNRSFSQLIASFIGFWCLGIHPMLLLAWPLFELSSGSTSLYWRLLSFDHRFSFTGPFLGSLISMNFFINSNFWIKVIVFYRRYDLILRVTCMFILVTLIFLLITYFLALYSFQGAF
jgi:hypothetical protein